MAERGARRRVLMVVSAFRPAMIADMQRARMLAWELPALGWDVEVLAPRASEVRQDVIEPEPDAFFAPDTRIHEVGSMARGVFEALGSRTHSWRTLWPMRQRGSALLRAQRFDLVYFTTTTFVYLALGPHWNRQFGIPYVLDFHDPWVKERIATRRAQRWSSRAMEWLGERMERSAVVGAAGVVAVSPRYVETLRRRYEASNPRWLAPTRHAVIPFGARAADLTEAARAPQASNRRARREIVLIYVGAGGAIMARSFILICRAIAALRAQGSSLPDRARITLFGTTYDWKPGQPKALEAAAQRVGVGDLVSELPGRVSFRHSLESLLKCDGALILGVDDAGYMPSKLFSYALSGKPLLASLHRDSPAFAQFQATPGLGRALWFDDNGEMPITDAAQVVASFLNAAATAESDDRRALLEPFLAPTMSLRHANLFDACLGEALRAPR